MPQVKGKVIWLENTHRAPPAIEPVRIDVSDVTIENERMEEAKQQMLNSLHLEKHKAFLDQQQEIKAAKSHVHKYNRVKNVIDPRKGLSCSLLVRRSRSFMYSSVTSEEDAGNNVSESHHLPQRSYSWSNVALPDNSNAWDPEFGRLPPVPFARQPVKMRHIPSVSSSYSDNGTSFNRDSKISLNAFSRKRTEILNQRDVNIGRSYQILRELSDVNKLSENGKGALRDRVIRERSHILSLYNDDLRSKIKDFHKNMDRFIVGNGSATNKLKEQRVLPKIY